MTLRVDVLVVGAGIHGAGISQAAAAAGHTVLTLEQTGIAAGTSCRSSKLIHGGLRYLETGQLALVRESLRERAILLRIAPQLVRLMPFHIPIYRHSQRSRLEIRAGLSLYALLDNLRRDAWFSTLPRRDWAALDGLSTEGLRAVFRYHDARTDDAALTRAVMRSAQTLGAELACPAEFVAAQRLDDGYLVRYRDASGEHECRAATVVNAGGPWVNTVLARIAPTPAPANVELVGGAHIVLDHALDHGAYYTEAEDGRAVFMLPWRGGLTLVGTTETPYHGDPGAVRPLDTEVQYLQRTFARYFPGRDVNLRDQFAGLRVLPRGTGRAFHRTRETLFVRDDPLRPRLLSVVGGKLTGYRATAEKVMLVLRGALPPRPARADTATLPLTD